MNDITAQLFSFANFQLDGVKRLLLKDGESVFLNSKALDLLLVLVKNHGQVVHKNDLLDEVWEGQFVEENNLTVHISALRKIFGDEKGKHQFIVTIPGKGYKFVADVKSSNDNDLSNSNSITNKNSLSPIIQNEFVRNDSIIGREQEIKDVKDLLRNENVRLVTLTGAGGTGKTRLALAIAEELKAEFSDGTFFVELASATDTKLVVLAISQTLHIIESNEKTLVESIKEFLSERQILLVLDNFEQVVIAAPFVRELLAESSRIKILVTSRTTLQLNVEHEFLVSPLELPPKDSMFSTEKIDNYPAIELFYRRAKASRPNFILTDENISVVAQICRDLDGLPLAIELAAARINLLSPQAILERLENSLKLLTGGAKNLPERQRTMRSAIQWSYDLLEEDEKKLFRRLAVFSNGFTVEAAEYIGENAKSSLKTEILDILNSLINNSLLFSKEQTDGNMRLQMLEVVREFALEDLEINKEIEDLRQSHAEFFLSLAEEAEPLLYGEKGVEWLERLEKENDNFRSALAWGLNNEHETAARIAASLRFFWSSRSYYSEALNWSRAALSITENSLSEARAKLLQSTGFFLRICGEFESAKTFYEKCIEESRKLNNLILLNRATQGLGAIAVFQKDYNLAQFLYQESLAMSRMEDDKIQLAYVLGSLGDLEMCRRNYPSARKYLEESIQLFIESGNKSAQTIMYFNLGTIDYFENLYEDAVLNFTESLRIAKETHSKKIIFYALDGFAAIAAVYGNYEQSAKIAGAVDNLGQSIGNNLGPAEEIFRQSYLTKVRKALTEKTFAEFYEKGQTTALDEIYNLIEHKQLKNKKNVSEEQSIEITIENHTISRITIEEEIVETNSN